MTKNTYPTLCAVQDHPELADLDESGVRLWAEAHDLELHRDWRGLLCTSEADAYKLRTILDTEHQRKAEADNARREQAELDDEIRLGRIRRRMEAEARRARLHAAIDEIPFHDERFQDWEQRATENGDAMFANLKAEANRPMPDTRTGVQRLKDKEAGR